MFTAILLLILAGWGWHANLAARELANRVAADTCSREGVQLLDGTVSVLRLSITRGPDGGLALRRTYVFDYSDDGFSRRRGFVVMTGQSLESVGLEPRAVS